MADAFQSSPSVKHNDTHSYLLRHKMLNAASQAGSDNEATPIELQELAQAIEALPTRYRDALSPAMQRVIDCSTRRRRILNLVQEALSQLRLDMKYLIFDLEATRRERDQYKAMIEGIDGEQD